MNQAENLEKYRSPFVYEESNFDLDLQKCLGYTKWEPEVVRSYFLSRYPKDEALWKEQRMWAAMTCLKNHPDEFKDYVREINGTTQFDGILIQALWRYFFASPDEWCQNLDFELIRLFAHEGKRAHKKP